MKLFIGKPLRNILLSLVALAWGWGLSAQDFGVRAFYLDFRTQVMTVDAIKHLADDLHEKGMNALMIEYEATFPFKEDATLRNGFAFSEEDVKEIVSYCSSLGMEVIPLQNCFGHCEYILRHPRYAGLREDPKKEVSQVCPMKIDEAVEAFKGIFSEVASLHPSRYMHIGCDETYLLGSCERCSKVPKAKLFADYVNAMCDIVRGLGKRPMIWADMVLKHPDAIPLLPKDLIYVDWNYGWAPDHFGPLSRLLESGAEVWGAAALRSYPDDVFLTRWEKHFDNLRDFVPYAMAHGYKGMIETTWSTSGTYGFHYGNRWEVFSMQPIRQVYPLDAFGILAAAYAKALSSSSPLPVDEFIKGYATEHYGLDGRESDALLGYFRLPQPEAADIPDLEKEIRVCEGAREGLAALRPRKNAREFGHYVLMMDIRIEYLKFKEIERSYEASGFGASDAAALSRRQKAVLAESEKTAKRFTGIHSGFLKPGQSEAIMDTWLEKPRELLRTLQNF